MNIVVDNAISHKSESKCVRYLALKTMNIVVDNAINPLVTTATMIVATTADGWCPPRLSLVIQPVPREAFGAL